MEGTDRSMVVTIRRSSGKAETSRVTRMSRDSRATIANAPACGKSEAATTARSNTFHPSAKKRSGRGQQARRRMPISTTKMVWTRTSIHWKTGP